MVFSLSSASFWVGVYEEDPRKKGHYTVDRQPRRTLVKRFTRENTETSMCVCVCVGRKNAEAREGRRTLARWEEKLLLEI